MASLIPMYLLSLLSKNEIKQFVNALLHERNAHKLYFHPDDLIKLYESWNLAFILSNLEDLYILIPKLMTPSVLTAKPEYYITTRIASLWLSINHILLRRLNRINEIIGPANKSNFI